MNTAPSGFLEQFCQEGLQRCIQGFYNFLVGIAVALAFLFIVMGALEYLASAAINRKEQGKNKITGAIKGLIVIFISGVVLYWINPNIFNAELIIYRVTNLQIPEFTGKEGLPGKLTPFGVSAPQLTENVAQTFENVLITRYYTPKESETKNFFNEVKMQGSGRCENIGKISVCKNYNGYINYQIQKISVPSDFCGFKPVARKTIAVPPEWHPSLVEIYINGKKDISGYGTDRGSAIQGQHVDIYVGEGTASFKSLVAYNRATIKIQKLKNCNSQELGVLRN